MAEIVDSCIVYEELCITRNVDCIQTIPTIYIHVYTVHIVVHCGKGNVYKDNNILM